MPTVRLSVFHLTATTTCRMTPECAERCTPSLPLCPSHRALSTSISDTPSGATATPRFPGVPLSRSGSLRAPLSFHVRKPHPYGKVVIPDIPCSTATILNILYYYFTLFIFFLLASP
ncbi:hypothetical protein FB451DRAFT_1395095 [Mycena latifolia]|nr:hypothetical protein FB451DRAFT_1395095 [Mycena latifolia]